MLRSSCGGIGVCTTPERLFAEAVTVVRNRGQVRSWLLTHEASSTIQRLWLAHCASNTRGPTTMS
jgi:hypothetical protein